MVLRDKANKVLIIPAQILTWLVLIALAVLCGVTFWPGLFPSTLHTESVLNSLYILYSLLLGLTLILWAVRPVSARVDNAYRTITLNGAKEFYATHDPVPMGASLKLSSDDEKKLRDLIQSRLEKKSSLRLKSSCQNRCKSTMISQTSLTTRHT